jgi:hemerythrin-like domain-containing protein
MDPSGENWDAPAPHPGADGTQALALAHLRGRRMLDALSRIAAAPDPDPATAARLAAALPVALALHMADEDEDFFPILRRRAQPEDELGPILSRLSREHADLAAAAVAAVGALAEIGVGAARRAAPVAAFVALKRRHAMFETAVILPMARVRLKPADRRALAARIAARRGLPASGLRSADEETSAHA